MAETETDEIARLRKALDDFRDTGYKQVVEVARAATGALGAIEKAQGELAGMTARVATKEDDLADLFHAVRDEHDRLHTDAWAVCRFETCRIAGEIVP